MMGITLGIVGVLAVCFIVWVFRGQNALVRAEELCGNALSQIGVQQSSRWDALTALADLAKEYSNQEYRTLMDVVAARRNIGPTANTEQVQQQEAMLAQSFGRVQALAEAYPGLKSNTVYLETMSSVRSYEENVRMSRMVYNDTVTKYNRLVRGLPGALIASFLGYQPRPYLEEDGQKAAMPNMTR